MRRIIAIIDPEAEYAQKLAEYINKHDFGGLKAVTFSDAGHFKKLEGNYDTRMMLVDEKQAGELHDAEEKYITICLSEDSFAATHYATVNKYSSAGAIVKFLLAKYTEVSKDVLTRTSLSRSHVITVYSPVGRCGKTAFAITIAQYLGLDSRCLMLSLDEFSGVFKYITTDAESDMSDVIYAYKQDKFSWAKLAQIACRFGSMDYIAPARYPEDLSVLTEEQMTDLLDKISMQSGYENIVIDLGSYGKRSAEVLEISNEIYMPTEGSKLSKCKVEEFRQTLNESGHGEIIGRIKEVELPFEERRGGMLMREEDYSYGKLFEYTRDLFTDPGQPDQTADGHEECQ